MTDSTFQIWSIVAMFVGPIVAVLITLWYQKRNDQLHIKYRLFITLMAKRKTNPPSQDWVDSLNTIDVVFADDPKVLMLWHEFYSLLNTPPPNPIAWEHKSIELLSAMALSLGYKGLQQVDIDKFYSPIAHGNQLEMSQNISAELLRVLQNTSHFIVKEKTGKPKSIKSKK